MEKDLSRIKVVVIGGSVMDLVFPIRELPNWKQAVQAHAFRLYPGGKGLNQSIAAARLGATVSIISAVGDDDFGGQIIDYFELHRVSHQYVQVVKSSFTDVTSVFVNEHGEPAFVGWKGISSSQITPEQLQRASPLIRDADILLITFEVSLDVVEEAISIANNEKTFIVVDPAPPLDLLDPPPYSLLINIDSLVPNFWEAGQLLRRESTAVELAMQLHTLGAKIVCVTNADKGCVVATKGKVTEHPSLFLGKPVDITGDTDAFCTAFAISIVSGKEMDDAVKIASAASALAVTKRGGAPSMPTLQEVNRFLTQVGLNIAL